MTRAGATDLLVALAPYTLTELEGMMRAAGFSAARVYLDMDGSPPSLDSYMVVAVAGRPDLPAPPVTG